MLFCFNVGVSKDLQKLAQQLDVRIHTGKVIYRLLHTLKVRDRSLNMARGGDGGETRNFEKNFGAPLKNYMPFQGPPLCILYFLKTPPLVPLENIVLY